MGILCGTILYPAITETKRRKYVVWGCRVVALALIIMAMVMTIKNFCMSPFPPTPPFPIERNERILMRWVQIQTTQIKLVNGANT